MNAKDRERVARLRVEVTREIVKLEKRYGQSLVSGAFGRHQQIRRERAKLARLRRDIDARIAKLQ